MTLLDLHLRFFVINPRASLRRTLTTLRRGSLPQQKGKSSAEFQLTEVSV